MASTVTAVFTCDNCEATEPGIVALNSAPTTFDRVHRPEGWTSIALDNEYDWGHVQSEICKACGDAVQGAIVEARLRALAQRRE